MIAASSPSFTAIPFPQALESISKEFQAWEIVAEGGHELRRIEKQFLELAPSTGLRFSVHAPMSDINIGSLNPRMREASLKELMTGLGACHRLGIDTYTVHPAFLTPLGFVSRDKVKEAARDSLERLDRISGDLGVKIALENMPRMYASTGTTPQELTELIEGTGLGICLDIGHAHTMGLVKEFLKLKKRIINLHVHDNRGEFDEHLPIGDGTVDFPRVIKGLKGYRGRYVIESRNLPDAVIGRDRLKALLNGH